MSDISRVFPEQFIGNCQRYWPYCSNTNIRAHDLSMAIIFKNDGGFLKIYTEGGQETIKIKPYPTKTMIRRIPPNVKFTIDMTPQEFETEGLDANKITVDSENLPTETLNKFIHMLRIFSDNVGNSGEYNARRTSIMF